MNPEMRWHGNVKHKKGRDHRRSGKLLKKTRKGNKTEEEQKEGDMRLSKLKGN